MAKRRDAEAMLNAGKDIAAVVDLPLKFATSERRACGVLGIPRSTQRYAVQPRTDEVAICQRLRAMVRQRPRFGDRRLTQLLKREGWTVNSKRIHRLCRSDNGPEFISKTIRAWLDRLGIEVLHIAPGSPWENGYVESFHSKFRDEFLNRELFENFQSAQQLTSNWRTDDNQHRPHSSLND